MSCLIIFYLELFVTNLSVTSQAVYEVRKSVVQRTNICICSTSSTRGARGAVLYQLYQESRESIADLLVYRSRIRLPYGSCSTHLKS